MGFFTASACKIGVREGNPLVLVHESSVMYALHQLYLPAWSTDGQRMTGSNGGRANDVVSELYRAVCIACGRQKRTIARLNWGHRKVQGKEQEGIRGAVEPIFGMMVICPFSELLRGLSAISQTNGSMTGAWAEFPLFNGRDKGLSPYVPRE